MVFTKFGDLLDIIGQVVGAGVIADNVNGACKDSENDLSTFSSAAQNVAVLAGGHRIKDMIPVTSFILNPAAMTVTLYKVVDDMQHGRRVSSGDILSITGNVVATIGAYGAMATATTLAAAAASPVLAASVLIGTGLGVAGIILNNSPKPTFCQWENLDTHRQPTAQVHDPLILDLDGDGIETIAMNGLSGSLFDHNNNGLRIATGWAGKDDGMLVRD